jgi:hypothetical protein
MSKDKELSDSKLCYKIVILVTFAIRVYLSSYISYKNIILLLINEETYTGMDSIRQAKQ